MTKIKSWDQNYLSLSDSLADTVDRLGNHLGSHLARSFVAIQHRWQLDRPLRMICTLSRMHRAIAQNELNLDKKRSETRFSYKHEVPRW